MSEECKGCKGEGVVWKLELCPTCKGKGKSTKSVKLAKSGKVFRYL
jgi:DnaJ-class molecular chaperone